MNELKIFIWQIIQWLSNLPTKFGILLRSFIYPFFIKMPLRLSKRKIVKIYKNVQITDPFNIEFGEGSSINIGCIFLSEGKIKIGKNVLIAPNCLFTSHQHSFSDNKKLIYEQPIIKSPIRIHDDVWVGAGAIILPGVEIHDGAIVGAGSIVTKDIPKMEIWAGNPAKKIKNR